MIHLPITSVAANRQAPKRLPIAMYIPSSSPPAEITDRISGAPFAKASSVTPEMVSLRLSAVEMRVRHGVKYVSATLPRMLKESRIRTT